MAWCYLEAQDTEQADSTHTRRTKTSEGPFGNAGKEADEL